MPGDEFDIKLKKVSDKSAYSLGAKYDIKTF